VRHAGSLQRRVETAVGMRDLAVVLGAGGQKEGWKPSAPTWATARSSVLKGSTRARVSLPGGPRAARKGEPAARPRFHQVIPKAPESEATAP
jgi:hypothetical protein